MVQYNSLLLPITFEFIFTVTVPFTRKRRDGRANLDEKDRYKLTRMTVLSGAVLFARQQIQYLVYLHRIILKSDGNCRQGRCRQT